MQLRTVEVAVKRVDPVTISTVYYKLNNSIISPKECAEHKKLDPTTVSRVKLDEAIKPLRATGVI